MFNFLTIHTILKIEFDILWNQNMVRGPGCSWLRACLACRKPWVWLLALHKNNIKWKQRIRKPRSFFATQWIQDHLGEMRLYFQKGKTKTNKWKKITKSQVTGKAGIPKRIRKVCGRESEVRFRLEKWNQMCYKLTPGPHGFFFFSSWTESQYQLPAAKLLERSKTNPPIQAHPILFISTVHWRTLLHIQRFKDLGTSPGNILLLFLLWKDDQIFSIWISSLPGGSSQPIFEENSWEICVMNHVILWAVVSF